MAKIKKTLQNSVPDEFVYFYTPIYQVKQTLQKTGRTELEPNEILHGLSMIHYATFVISEIYRQNSQDISKILATRQLVENILEKNSYQLENQQASQLISFIDQVAKALNTNLTLYTFIALYRGNQNAEIYRKLHNHLGIYDFLVNDAFLNPLVLNSVKSYHDVSIELLTEQGLSINIQPVTHQKTNK